MEKKNVIEIACYEREHLSHDMFAKMDWEIDSVMREIEKPQVQMLAESYK